MSNAHPERFFLNALGALVATMVILEWWLEIGIARHERPLKCFEAAFVLDWIKFSLWISIAVFTFITVHYLLTPGSLLAALRPLPE